MLKDSDLPLRSWFIGVFHAIAERLYVNALSLKVGNPRLMGLLRKEMRECAITALYQDTEAEFFKSRLERRYDIGLALNEAANRAIDAKKVYLTSNQRAALRLQQGTLQRWVNES